MKTDKTQSTVLGILFIAVMVTWSFGFALINPIINAADFLTQVNKNTISLLIGVCMEFLEMLCVIGIVVTVYPLMKKFNERFALWYSFVRILEVVTLLSIALCGIFLIPLSHLYLESTDLEISTLEKMGVLLVQIREKWTGLPISIFYGTSAIVFQYFLYKTRLVPSFISIWGIISAILVLLVSPFEMLGYDFLGFVGISMGLNEIFLGIWLVVKGFNESNKDENANDEIPKAFFENENNRFIFPMMFL